MHLAKIALLPVATSAVFLASMCSGPKGTFLIDEGVALERVFPRLRFRRPVFLCGAGDGSGRMFVTEQEGVIRVFETSSDPATSQVFLDISAHVSRRGNEEGLLGLAFHPEFETNGEFFVHYSSNDPDMTGVVSRFRVSADDPNRADPSSEELILRQKQPYRNHNGGMIAFGPDGYLYISFGDGGSANDPQGNGQNALNWLGSILRVDVDRTSDGKNYFVPPQNPFVTATDFAAPETWAFGLRNVWRFSFDRETGELWGADVGQNTWEEIDLITAGGNYGWNRFEANDVFSEEAWLPEDMHTGPVATYGRDLGISVTGGYVYRGSAQTALRGAYFYGDYATGNLWRLTKDEAGSFQNELVGRTGRSIASFGEDDDGELYLLSFDGGIYRIVSTEEQEATFADWPQTLSETGLFASVPRNEVAGHVHTYEVNAPFWSDGASKERYFVLPEGETLGYRENGAWDVPVGATLVKSFRANDRGRNRVLETRLIRRTAKGWEAATYVWDLDGREARLAVEGQQFELYDREAGVKSWHAPSASECSSCHVEATGYPLGMRTPQLNREVGGQNQIAAWIEQGLLSGVETFDESSASRFLDPHGDEGSLETRARVWLDVNCAMCHQPNGPGNASIDLRNETPLSAANLIDEPPSQGDLGLTNARIVAPGEPDRSTLLHRTATLGDGRMPNVGTNQIDEQAVELLRLWIEGLDQR